MPFPVDYRIYPTKAELVALSKQRGVKRYYKMDKFTLAKALVLPLSTLRCRRIEKIAEQEVIDKIRGERLSKERGVGIARLESEALQRPWWWGEYFSLPPDYNDDWADRADKLATVKLVIK